MNKKIAVLILPVLLILTTHAFGRSIISGQVVDAKTGQPIEGVAIFVEWTKSPFGPPGLDYEETVEAAETLTDSAGHFDIPKYSTLFKSFKMAVYKNGYVCWSSWKIFPGWRNRKGFKPKNRIVIRLERLEKEYSKEAHADFTLKMSIGCRAEFRKAIRIEREIQRNHIVQKRGEESEAMK